jgi:hypothetical protein
MVGICSQWAVDKEFKPNELAVYLSIVRNSFGFKHRWCYMSYSDFVITNRNTLSKILLDFEERGIISRKQTYKDNGHRSKVEYKILEPKVNINKFVFNSKEILDGKTNINEDEEAWQ